MSSPNSLVAATAALGVMVISSSAAAVPFAVKLACASDYYAYCSQHDSGSPDAKQCMRANGSKLSRRCVKALVDAGYVSKARVAKKRSLR